MVRGPDLCAKGRGSYERRGAGAADAAVAEAAAQLAVEMFRTYVESWYARDWWLRWRRETR